MESFEEIPPYDVERLSLHDSDSETELKTMPSKSKHIVLGLEERFSKTSLPKFDFLEEGRSFDDLKRNKYAKGWTFKNEKDKLVPTRKTMRWNKNISYRKIKNVTEENHYPLPFFDKFLKRIVDHEFHWYLDGYSGYDQILIDPG